MKFRHASVLCAFFLVLTTSFSNAQQTSKPATQATKDLNAAVLTQLPFDDVQDFEDAKRGFIARPETLTIKNANGDVVWDMESYKSFIKLDAASPDTVNPSLWRMARLQMEHGLYEVDENIYQVRGYDLSNITFVKGETGWIVFDPLVSAETAQAAYELLSENVGEFPVHAVVYSHSHVDHYAGIKGIVDEADVVSGKVKVFAPDGFMEHAVSENVIAGNVMSRRATFMYAMLLPRNAKAGVNAGLGFTTSTGNQTLITPSESVSETGQEFVVDGVKMVFQMTPGTEAPAEMNTYFPELNALWMAENTTNTMHNILTLRGAQVRDPLIWANFIDETMALYGGEVKVKFQSHHWPVWGNENIITYFKKQRDVYKFMHDRTVNLMNKGYTGSEIADVIKLPPELESNWATRGYYGTLRHNSRAIYQRYMGWYDGNPSNLNNLSPEPAAKKYVQYMGGEDNALKNAQIDFDKAEYRWVAEVLKHVVFANPDNTQAKNLLADTLEQLGYQAESGPWRSVYLQGAFELRNGAPDLELPSSASVDVVKAMPPEMLFDFLAVRLDGEKAGGKVIRLNINFTDLEQTFGLIVENGVLHHGDAIDGADATMTITKTTLDEIQLGAVSIEDAKTSGDIKIQGKEESFAEFMSLIDDFSLWFNVVTP